MWEVLGGVERTPGCLPRLRTVMQMGQNVKLGEISSMAQLVVSGYRGRSVGLLRLEIHCSLSYSVMHWFIRSFIHFMSIS